MANFITRCQLKLELSNHRLTGCIVGDSGRRQRDIETSTGATIRIKDNIVTIESTGLIAVKTVKAAESKIMKIIEDHCFEAQISDKQAGLIIGPGGETLKGIWNSTKAHVHLSNPNIENRRKITLLGRSDQFSKAKMEILDKLEAQYRIDFEVENPKKCFRTSVINGGEQKAFYVSDQLPPNPDIFFLQFHSKLANSEENYEPRKINHVEKVPPSALGKNCGILAPFEHFLYRAKVLAIQRSDENIYLLVKFVDFGNISLVDLFKCQDLDTKYLYPPHATSCQLKNIRQQVWNKESLDMFRQYMNKNTRNIRVKVLRNISTSELLMVEVVIKNVGDIGSLLVDSGLAFWSEEPFEPFPKTRKNLIGSSEMLYAKGSWGGTVRIDVVSSILNKDAKNKQFTCTSHFQTESMMNSLTTAYNFCRNYLEEKNNNFLDTHTLHFSMENIDTYQHKYNGPSAGVVFALCILSECLKLEIPLEVAGTGQISGHGDVYPVGCLREKIVAASKNGKKVVFVPEQNALESFDLQIEGIDLKPLNNMNSLIKLLWNI